MKDKSRSKTIKNQSPQLMWRWEPFGKVFDFLTSYSFSREQLTSTPTKDKIQVIHYGDIHATYESEILDLSIDTRVPYVMDGLLSKNELKGSNSPLLKDGDLIIADASEDHDGLAESVELLNVGNRKIIGGLHTIVARDTRNMTAIGFRTYVLSHTKVRREIFRIGQGTSVFGISKSSLAKINIPLPPLAVQTEIAQALAKWDLAITKLQNLIILKQHQKDWLTHQLLFGKRRSSHFVLNKQSQKTRLGVLPKDWKLVQLDKVLKKVRKSFIPEPSKTYQEIGIRSHGKGIFYKEQTNGKKIGNKTVFWIQPDCFILNIVFAWEHAVAKTTKKEHGMIASHRFPMFEPAKDKLDLDYLLYFFKTGRGKHLLGLASPGGAGRNKTLGQDDFLKLQIPLPSIEEQQHIASCISYAEKEIEILMQMEDQLRKQKKGLIQRLLKQV